jgi:hypothetical protein
MLTATKPAVCPLVSLLTAINTPPPERLRDVPSTNESAATMAGIRLRATLDAAQRAGLSAGDLLALAGRVESNETTDADAALMAALDVLDLVAVKMTAGEFIMAYSAPLRTVAAVMRAASTRTPGRVKAALEAMRGTAEALRECLRRLPGEDELDAIGNRLVQGWHTSADLAVVRAVPGPWLRVHASDEHWPAFVDYRLHDF